MLPVAWFVTQICLFTNAIPARTIINADQTENAAIARLQFCYALAVEICNPDIVAVEGDTGRIFTRIKCSQLDSILTRSFVHIVAIVVGPIYNPSKGQCGVT